MTGGARNNKGAQSAIRNQTWTRDQVLRQLSLRPALLNSWVKQGLLAPDHGGEEFHFQDLIALKVLLRLKALGLSAKKLRDSFDSLREKLSDIENPLAELRVYGEGGQIRVEVDGKKMEALSGQLLFDFDQAEIRRLLSFPGAGARNDKDAREQQRKARSEAESWFQRGLELEQSGADKREAIEAYQKALELYPQLCGAHVNIGTIYFNARKWREAQKHYENAIQSDPQYALAHFNLANLHEELGRSSLAITHYKKALEIHPSYADAHYNLALLFQTRERVMEALRHWKQYLKLDPSSYWAAIAKREMTKLKEAALVQMPAATQVASEEAAAVQAHPK